MEPHADYEQISLVIQKEREKAASWSGLIYRSTSLRHATSAEILSGEGSLRRGGRWNVPGTKVIYGCLTPETAMAETLQHYRYYGIAVQDAMPRVFVAIEVSIQRSMDLTNTDRLSDLGNYLRQSLEEDWRAINSRAAEALGQAIGRAAFNAGIEALLTPSSVDKEGTNLAIFRDSLLSGSTLKVLNR